MKTLLKITTVLLFTIISVVGYGQAVTPVPDYRIADTATAVGINLPPGTIITVNTGGAGAGVWYCTHAIASTKHLGDKNGGATPYYFTQLASGAAHNAVTINATANGLSVDGSQVITLGLASSGVTGALSGTDWTTFNNKQSTANMITDSKRSTSTTKYYNAVSSNAQLDSVAALKAAVGQTMYIGTTSVAINRGSGALVLTGITSIDGSSASTTGNAATVTNGFYTTNLRTDSKRSTLSTAAYNTVTANAVIDSVAALKAAVAQVHYVGTTSIAANRASASQALTGITSIDGSSASCTGNAATATALVAQAAYTMVGNNTGSSAAPTALSAANSRALMNVQTVQENYESAGDSTATITGGRYIVHLGHTPQGIGTVTVSVNGKPLSNTSPYAQYSLVQTSYIRIVGVPIGLYDQISVTYPY